jgi:hypothetical protein
MSGDGQGQGARLLVKARRLMRAWAEDREWGDLKARMHSRYKNVHRVKVVPGVAERKPKPKVRFR